MYACSYSETHSSRFYSDQLPAVYVKLFTGIKESQTPQPKTSYLSNTGP